MTVEVGAARRARRSGRLVDARPDVRVVLAGLWVSMLFVFAYVDILGFWRGSAPLRPDVCIRQS